MSAGLGRRSFWVHRGSALQVGLLHESASGAPWAEVTGIHRLESDFGEQQIVQAVRELPLEPSSIVLLAALSGPAGGEFLALDAVSGYKLQRWCGMPLAAAPGALAVELEFVRPGDLKCAAGLSTGEVRLYNCWFDCAQAAAAAGAADAAESTAEHFPWPAQQDAASARPTSGAVTALVWLALSPNAVLLAVGWESGEFGVLRARDGLSLDRRRAPLTSAEDGGAVTLLERGADDEAGDAPASTLWVSTRAGLSLWRVDAAGSLSMILQTAATGGLRGAHVLTAGESVVLLGAPVTSARLPVPHVVHVTSAEGATARAPEPLAPLADESGAGVLFVGSWVEPLSVEHDPVALIAPLRALLCAASGTTKHAQPRDLSPSFAGWVLGMVYPEGQGEPPEPILLPFGRTTKAVAALDELEARAPAVFTPGSADPALARECVASGLADGDDAHSAIIQAALYSGRAALLCEYIASRDGDVYDDQRWHRPLAELVEAEFRRTRAAITAFASDYVWTQTGESRATCDIIAGAQPIVEGVALVLGALSDRATDDDARAELSRVTAEAQGFSLTLRATAVLSGDAALRARFDLTRLGAVRGGLVAWLLQRAALEDSAFPPANGAGLFTLPAVDEPTDAEACRWRACLMLYGLVRALDEASKGDDERVRAAEDAVERFGSALVLPRTMRSLALGVWAVDLCASQQQQSTRIRAHARELLRTLGAAGADPELRLNVLRAVLRMPGEGSSGELPGVIALGASEMHGDAQITLTAVEAALAGGHWELGFALQRSSCAVAAEGDNERALLLCVEWMWTRRRLHELLLLPLSPREELVLLRFLSARVRKGEPAAKPALLAYLLERGRIVDAIGLHKHLPSANPQLDEFAAVLVANYERVLPPALREALGSEEHEAPVRALLAELAESPVRESTVAPPTAVVPEANPWQSPWATRDAAALTNAVDTSIGASLWAPPEAPSLFSPGAAPSPHGSESPYLHRRVSHLRAPPIKMSHGAPPQNVARAGFAGLDVAPDGDSWMTDAGQGPSPAAGAPAPFVSPVLGGAQDASASTTPGTAKKVSFGPAHQPAEMRTPASSRAAGIGRSSARRSGAGARELASLNPENIIDQPRPRRSSRNR